MSKVVTTKIQTAGLLVNSIIQGTPTLQKPSASRVATMFKDVYAGISGALETEDPEDLKDAPPATNGGFTGGTSGDE